MHIDEENYLAHYGIIRRSGRYPWGSGGWGNGGSETVGQRSKSFLDYIKQLLGMGMKESEVAEGLGMSLVELRAVKSVASAEAKAADVLFAQRLKDKQMSTSAIARRMGLNESSVRALLAPGAADKKAQLDSIVNMLSENLKKHEYLDIGAGVENHLGVSPERLRAAVAVLKDQGFEEINVQTPQVNQQTKTTVKILAPEGTTYKEANENQHKIGSITDVSEDGGRSWSSIQPPISIGKNRVEVVYGPDGGDQADGLIYVRPGVEDISLGTARYAQVRIVVENSHYLKGMAMYKDDLPPGVDLVFHTNKEAKGDKLNAMKPLKDDPENPFGSFVRQLPQIGPDGAEIPNTVRSAMNIVNEEGKWGEWSNNLSSQMLSKQSHLLAKRQLDIAYQQKLDALDEINALTNPVVKRKLLEEFADSADSAAWQLKAANMPGQATHVILPMPQLKDTEVFAPNYENGTRVALVRYPHGGTFEIPELVVNNTNAEAKKLMGANAPDAIGINAKVAARLSGADFDGDTVLVIPNNKGLIQSTPALERLKGFDPQSYKIPDGSSIPKIKESTMQTEMGKVSNLISDMTIRGASPNELASAVRHSMVVIDSYKHGLNYKQSAIDNGISNLTKKYQAPFNESGRPGASTLLSRRKSEIDVEKRPERGIDPLTGRKIFGPPETYTTRDGVVVTKTTKRKKLEVTDDAHTLSSGTQMEKVYADHSNNMKSLANQARKLAVNTPTAKVSPSAKTVYAREVARLDAALNLANQNRPRERQAQLIARTQIQIKKQAKPDMDRSELKKLESFELEKARNRTGAGKKKIVVSDKEWEAIQAGAVSPTKLRSILDNSDMDQVRKLATPKTTVLMTSTKQARAKALMSSGLTQAEVASILGVSLSTLKRGIA